MEATTNYQTLAFLAVSDFVAQYKEKESLSDFRSNMDAGLGDLFYRITFKKGKAVDISIDLSTDYDGENVTGNFTVSKKNALDFLNSFLDGFQMELTPEEEEPSRWKDLYYERKYEIAL